MADKQFNITNNSPNYTKNNNINNINYVKRNGAGWSWFKTIFIACMLTIFSVVCFGGGVNSLPKNYTNTMKNEIIKVPIGQPITIDTLNISNLHKAKLKLNTNNKYVSFHELTNNTPTSSGTASTEDTYVSTGFGSLDFNITFGSMTSRYSSTSSSTFNSSLYYRIRESYYYNYGKPTYRIYIGFYRNSSTYSSSLNLFTYITQTNNYTFTNNSYDFTLQFNSDIFNYLVDITPDIFLTWIKSNFILINAHELNTYIEYPVKYATYDWNIKLTQLSKLKNVFTPLFSSNIPDEQATLQKGFDQFQEFIDLGVLTYTGDKITPNRKMSENWEYNVNISSFTKFDEMIHLLNSNLGKYINANYWYDNTTREFVRFDTNVIYGSINDTNTTLKNVINLLSYPITTGFNITYNIGVLFTFIFVW